MWASHHVLQHKLPEYNHVFFVYCLCVLFESNKPRPLCGHHTTFFNRHGVKGYHAKYFSSVHRFAGLVVRASASGAEDPAFEYHLRWDFPGSSHTSDLTGTPVATLPGAWHNRVSTGTVQLGVSILWLGEVERLVCNFSVSQHGKLSEQIRPWDTPACCWDVKQPTNKQTNSSVRWEMI